MHTTNSACPTGLQPTTDLERLGERIATLSAQILVATPPASRAAARARQSRRLGQWLP